MTDRSDAELDALAQRIADVDGGPVPVDLLADVQRLPPGRLDRLRRLVLEDPDVAQRRATWSAVMAAQTETWEHERRRAEDDAAAAADPETTRLLQQRLGPETSALAESHAICRRWLGKDYDLDAWDATLAVAAVEQLDGDPAWLLVLGGSGNAKTETVQALRTTPAVTVTSTISSAGALLSGTPRRERTTMATGGLLRKVGERGVLVIKDVTSVLSMDRSGRAEVLAALRELHDGFWERNVGTDGGRSLTWSGRLVVVGAVTTAWDHAHAVVAAMGDRFVVLRLGMTAGERKEVGRRSIGNAGGEAKMRAELADAAARVLAELDRRPVELTEHEVDTLVAAADLVTRVRTAVEADPHGEPTEPHALEAPTRFAKQLAQVVRGGVAIGLDRADALRLAVRCARDSVPPLRPTAMRDLRGAPDSTASGVATRVGRPRTTVARCLDSLWLLGAVTRQSAPNGSHTFRLAAGLSPGVLGGGPAEGSC